MPLTSHVSDEASPADRGRAFGIAHQAAVTNTVSVYRRMFAESCALGVCDIDRFGEQVAATLAAQHPDILDEILAIANGAEVSETELVAINARTELLAGHTPPECSVLAFEPRATDSACLLAQTWDWHPALEGSRILWTVRNGPGPSFVTLTEAGILAKIGVNANGLACGLNFLTSAADGGAEGTPIHVLLRLLLERSANPEQALHLLLNTTTSASACITIAYGDGQDGVVFGIELAPGSSRAVPAHTGGTFVHTNHFLREPHGTTDVGIHEYPDTLVRFSFLKGQLERLASPPTDRELRAVLSSHFASPGSVCKHETASDPWAEQRRTLVAVVINASQRSFAISDGPPCEGTWLEVAVPAASAARTPAPISEVA